MFLSYYIPAHLSTISKMEALIKKMKPESNKQKESIMVQQ